LELATTYGVTSRTIERDGQFARAVEMVKQADPEIEKKVHHTKYPPWGTFEWNADGLIDVCHGCHCKIHGKDK